MDSNPPLKTKYTGAEIMQLFTKSPPLEPVKSKNPKYLKYTANLAYPSMFKNKMNKNEK